MVRSHATSAKKDECLPLLATTGSGFVPSMRSFDGGEKVNDEKTTTTYSCCTNIATIATAASQSNDGNSSVAKESNMRYYDDVITNTSNDGDSNDPFILHHSISNISSARNGGMKRSYSYTDFHAEKQHQQQQQHENEMFPLQLPLQILHHQKELFSNQMESVFSSVRSCRSCQESDVNDSEVYLRSTVFKKAFPERYIALIVTLIFELPTLFMISGGSSRLCILMGRKKYQLLVAFLPLASAISGNVGLQSSTLTTRAISHQHVLKSNYFDTWLTKEMGVALCLGIALGAVIGSVAYIASGYDPAFGLTIAMAQILSIVTAGFTGTLAPILFTYIFHQDSGKWGGPLETAIQDIVGSFAMVVVSYHLLVLLGPHEISPDDMCGSDGSGAET